MSVVELVDKLKESMLFAQRKIERLEREKSDLKKQLEDTEFSLLISEQTKYCTKCKTDSMISDCSYREWN